MAARRHDWTAYKTEFATGTDSLRAFATQKRISVSKVIERAQRDGWEEARKAFQASVAARVTTDRAQARVRLEQEIDERAHVTNDLIQNEVHQRITMIRKGTLKASSLDLKLLAEAQQKAYEQQRLSAGLPKERVPTKVQVEAHVEVATGVMELPVPTDD